MAQNVKFFFFVCFKELEDSLTGKKFKSISSKIITIKKITIKFNKKDKIFFNFIILFDSIYLIHLIILEAPQINLLQDHSLQH